MRNRDRASAAVRRGTVLGLVLVMITVFAGTSEAQDVPANLQATILKKVFAFDDQLSGGSVEVIVAHGGDAAEAGEIVSAFEGVGLSATVVAVGGLADTVGPGTVVYVMPDAGAVKGVTTANGVLSVTGETSLVESGEVSVAIGIEGGKPKIIVNMSALSAEGHSLGADVLKLAKRIG